MIIGVCRACAVLSPFTFFSEHSTVFSEHSTDADARIYTHILIPINVRTPTVGVLGTGSPGLLACGPRRGSTRGPVRPVFTNKRLRPSRGAKPREADDTRPPRGQPHQAGSRGAERSRQGEPREVPTTSAMTTKARRAPACTVSSFPLWCLRGKRRRGVPRHQAKVSILVQRDQDQQDNKTKVTVEPKTASPPEPLAGEDHL